MLLLFKIVKRKKMKEFEEITIKNNNEIDLPKIINSEVNLLVFHFFLFPQKALKIKPQLFIRK